MGFISRSFWYGDEILWKIFWVYGVFAIFMAKVAAIVIRLISGIDFDNLTSGQAQNLLWFQAFYLFWLLGSLWRCAFNVENSFWGYLTRTLVVLFIIFLGMLVFMHGAVPDPFKMLTKWMNYAQIRWR